jgi:dihydroorotate dehydrogenase (NAD+) catalytic subunit
MGLRLDVVLGSVTLTSPVMTASGTAGHGVELAPYVDLARLGAVVVKSLSAQPWPGNAAPRLIGAPQGMLNAVGLQGPGLDHWLTHDLPELRRRGVTVVASIWGRSVAEYVEAAEALRGADVAAVEVNLSCPNLEGRRGIFAHDPVLSAEVIDAVSVAGLPRWAKLSPNTDRVVEVAAAVQEAGAEAVTLINTLLGMILDPHTGRPALAAGGGGWSGRAVHPVAVRTVYDVHAAHPTLPIIGVGGVTDGWSAAELMLAGASAVQVGTASFADPRAAGRILDELISLVRRRGYDATSSIVGLAHRGGW